MDIRSYDTGKQFESPDSFNTFSNALKSLVKRHHLDACENDKSLHNQDLSHEGNTVEREKIPPTNKVAPNTEQIFPDTEILICEVNPEIFSRIENSHNRHPHSNDWELGKKSTLESKLPVYSGKVQEPITNHEANNPLSCEECGTTSYDEFSFKQHVRFHSNQRMLASCPVCFKVFSRGFLSLHLRYHVSKKRFKCKICPKAFSTKYRLNMHHLCAHVNGSPLHVYNKDNSCLECGKKFRLKTSLFTHFWQYHQKKRFQCDKCEKSFFTAKGITKHMESHFNGKGFSHEEYGISYNLEGNAAQQLNSLSLVTEQFPEKKLNHPESLHLKEQQQATHFEDEIEYIPVSSGGANNFEKQSSHLNTFTCDGCQKVYVGKKPLACSVCKREFSSEPSSVLVSSNHSDEPLNGVFCDNKPFKCFFCSKGFSRISCLQVHLQFHSCKDWTCGLCGGIFSSQSSLRKHIRRHGEEDKYECEICKKTFFTKLQLNAHLRQHSFVCEVCGKCFENKKVYRKHVHGHKERPYMCDICKKSFSEKRTLDVHRQTHMEKRSYSCEECGKTYSWLDGLKTHLLLHRKENQCDICGKSFYEKSKLEEHKNVHSGVTPFNCELCGKSFFTSRSHRAHTRSCSETKKSNASCKQQLKPGNAEDTPMSTSGENCSEKVSSSSSTFTCEGCQKVYVGKKPQSCDNCKKEFSSEPISILGPLDLSVKPSCQSLSEAVSDNNQIPIVQNKKNQCDICGKSFPRKWRLEEHRNVHLGLKPFLCQFCGKGFSGRQSRNTHNCSTVGSIAIYKTKVEPCNVCGKKFTKWAMTKHLRTHTGEKPFKCESCGKRFFMKISLNVHRCPNSEDSRNPYLKPCKVCGKRYAYFNMAKHLRSHTKEKPCLCEICGKWYSKDYINLHRRIHSTSTDQFKCKECEKSYSSYNSFRSHLRTHRKSSSIKQGQTNSSEQTNGYPKSQQQTKTRQYGEKIPCEVCGEKLYPFNMKRHLATTHTITESLLCDICGKSYTLQRHLDKHILTHAEGKETNRRKFPCKECGKKFNTRKEAEDHPNIDAGLKPYKCEVCGKDFATSKQYEQHCRYTKCSEPSDPNAPKRKILTSSEPKAPKRKILTCDTCGKTFWAEQSLIQHIALHTGEKPFKCDICDKRFSVKQGLQYHLLVHKGVKDFLCNQCSKTFYTKSELHTHSKICGIEKPYSCPFCDKRFKYVSAMSSHKRVHTGVKNFVCKFCQKRFSTSGRLTRHIRIHTGEKPFQCNVCQKGFAQSYNLKIHMRTHNRNASIPSSSRNTAGGNAAKSTGVTNESYRVDAPLAFGLTHQTEIRDAYVPSGLTHGTYNSGAPLSSCFTNRKDVRDAHLPSYLPNHDISGKSYTLQRHSDKHILTHTEGNQSDFKCKESGKKFQPRKEAEDHRNVHAGLKPFKCEVCGKSFAFKKYLQYHRVHTKCMKPSDPKAPNRKIFTCETCGKTFRAEQALIKHMAFHIHDKPFKCDICDTKFSVEANLNYHLLVHKGVKDFVCNQCSEAFYTEIELNAHSKICGKEKPYECPFCEKRFMCASTLKSHKRTHAEVKNFVCKFCQKGFSTGSKLTRHIRTHTGEKPYQCNVCQKKFNQSDGLKNHMRTHNRNSSIPSSSKNTAGGNAAKSTGVTKEYHRVDAPVASGLTHHTENRDAFVPSGSTQHTENRDVYVPSGLTHHTENRDVYVPSGLTHHTENRDVHVPSGLTHHTENRDVYFPSGLTHDTRNRDVYVPSGLTHGTYNSGAPLSSCFINRNDVRDAHLPSYLPNHAKSYHTPMSSGVLNPELRLESSTVYTPPVWGNQNMY